MNKIIENNISGIEKLCHKHMVKTLYLFGSINTKKFNDNSDIDFLISFDDSLSLMDYADNFFDLEDALKKLLKRPVDLVVEKSVRNPYLSAKNFANKSLAP